jgi:hypothetical protein
MIMTNTGPNSLNGDLHAVPTVHLSHLDRPAILAAAALSQPALIRTSSAVTPTPEVAAFSSRGPSTTTEGDILKPDISAPGVDVLAAVAPPTHNGRAYDLLSGTSMSSPHIAGLAALVKAAKPEWSPAAVKSALMTTARDHVSEASRDPFAQGAGFVVPNKAVDPGLVFPSGATDWRRYMVGLGVTFTGANANLTALDGSDLNQASLAIGSFAGSHTVKRTVTNVSGQSETYTVTEQVPGVEVTATPATFEIGAGESLEVTLTTRYDGGTIGQWAKGSLTFDGTAHDVRIPVAVRPVAISAPVEVSGSSLSGSKAFSVTPGFSGPLTPQVTGLVGATPTVGTVATGAFAPSPSAATKAFPFQVPVGTPLVRFDLDALSAADDLDLFLYDAGNELVAFSATGAADEQVTLSSLAPGAYTAYVNGYSTGGGGAFSYTAWAVPAGAVGNAAVSPPTQTVTVGQPVDLAVTWKGLTAGQRYLGYITYREGSAERTVVSIG